jgi:6-pyruvoyltetrahydropterin/6-carboxytetrahydropterin synthase
MHRLAREIRFSVDPFSKGGAIGSNSYCSKPCGEGLSIYFSLLTELEGRVNNDTGFVVNVTEIDKAVRAKAVPVFEERIRKSFGNGEGVSYFDLYEMLKKSWGLISSEFGENKLTKLVLSINPFRKLSIDSEDSKVFYYSEKFEFAATHQLWNEKFSEEENYDRFGKCANPNGHGHNYIAEVTVKKPAGNGDQGWTEKFEKIVDENLISVVDHKNLNEDVEAFSDKNPTVENITSFAWDKLKGKFGVAELSSITIWETDRTYCAYSG